MRRALLPIALLMAYLMVPGGGELMELAVHWVQHGDSAHAKSEGHGPQEGDDEHGCSGLFHVCACHHGTGFVAEVTRPTVSAAPTSDQPATRWSHETPHAICFSDIFRPPIA